MRGPASIPTHLVGLPIAAFVVTLVLRGGAPLRPFRGFFARSGTPVGVYVKPDPTPW
jgi:hypothetical protein